MYKKIFIFCFVAIFVSIHCTDDFEKELYDAFIINERSASEKGFPVIKKSGDNYSVDALGGPLFLISSLTVPPYKTLRLKNFTHLVGYFTKIGVSRTACLVVDVDCLFGIEVVLEFFGISKKMFNGDIVYVINNFKVDKCYCTNYTFSDNPEYLTVWFHDSRIKKSTNFYYLLTRAKYKHIKSPLIYAINSPIIDSPTIDCSVSLF